MQANDLAINAHNNDATPCDIRPEHDKKEEKFNKTFAKKFFYGIFNKSDLLIRLLANGGNTWRKSISD